MYEKQNYRILKTRFGWAGVAASDRGITRIVLPKKGKTGVMRELAIRKSGAAGSEAQAALLDTAVGLLEKYFLGEYIRFNLPLDVRSYTVFQRAVWRAVKRISSGEMRSYAWIARTIKKPLAARAVGQAVGANPIPILIP